MAGQSSLFGDVPDDRSGSIDGSRHSPLATRMRPRTFEEFVGQHRAIGAGTVLRRAVEAGEVPSLILWGPPGSGKTTLAGLIAGATNATFEAVSATSAGVADLRKVIDRAASVCGPDAARSSSSTRSTASTRASRMPCSPTWRTRR